MNSKLLSLESKSIPPSSTTTYMDSTENLTFLKFIHTTLSLPSFLFFFYRLSFSSLSITTPYNLENKSFILFNFQSFKGPEKQGLQWPLSLVWPYKSAIQTTFAVVRHMKKGRKHTTIQPHTIYSFKTSPSFHYPPQMKIYYNSCSNPS